MLIEFFLLIASSAVALCYATPKQISALKRAGVEYSPQKVPAVLQGIIFSSIAAGLGIALRGTTGFSLLLPGELIGTTLLATLIGLLGHLFLYYLVFRPRICRQDMLLAEQIRLGMGLPARMLQGGIVEEVQFRWGLMSVFVAIFSIMLPSTSSYPVLVAILISALLFALVHFLGGRQIGLARGRWESGLIMADNIWVGMVFGFLLWKAGLMAAMISHALIHVGWFPVEKRVYQRDVARAGNVSPTR